MLLPVDTPGIAVLENAVVPGAAYTSHFVPSVRSSLGDWPGNTFQGMKFLREGTSGMIVRKD